MRYFLLVIKYYRVHLFSTFLFPRCFMVSCPFLLGLMHYFFTVLRNDFDVYCWLPCVFVAGKLFQLAVLLAECSVYLAILSVCVVTALYGGYFPLMLRRM
jgi:hypothetical protein